MVRDDTYYAAMQEFETLQQRNPKGFVDGTPDAARSRELMDLMDARAKALE